MPTVSFMVLVVTRSVGRPGRCHSCSRALAVLICISTARLLEFFLASKELWPQVGRGGDHSPAPDPVSRALTPGRQDSRRKKSRPRAVCRPKKKVTADDSGFQTWRSGRV